MIMDMGFIYMRTDYESVIAFCPAHGKLVPDLQRLFGSYLARTKALPGVIGDDITAALIPAGELFVLLLG